jgi:hypothetical protein
MRHCRSRSGSPWQREGETMMSWSEIELVDAPLGEPGGSDGTTGPQEEPWLEPRREGAIATQEEDDLDEFDEDDFDDDFDDDFEEEFDEDFDDLDDDLDEEEEVEEEGLIEEVEDDEDEDFEEGFEAADEEEDEDEGAE